MLQLVLLCAGYSVCIILGHYENNGEFTPKWASRSYCIFSLSVAALSLLVASMQLIKTSVMLYKETRQTFVITFKMTFFALVMVNLILISGITVSWGFDVWCNAVEERFSKGCQTAAASMTFTNNTDNQIAVKGFFADLETSQFSVWSALVVWVFVLTISGRMLFEAHERANIKISMRRERLRYNPPLDYANQPSNLPHRGIT